MKTHYLLVDFENVQPANLAILRGTGCHLLVFLGAAQTRLRTDLVVELQALGPDASYVRCAASGPNALDFHIAYYIGDLAAKHPDAHFTIISRDKGFDPLIRHLQTRHVSCERHISLDQVPGLPKAPTPSPAAKPRKAASASASRPKNSAASNVLDKVRHNLARRGNARPRTVKTLHSIVRQITGANTDDATVQNIISELAQLGELAVEGNKVTYPSAS